MRPLSQNLSLSISTGVGLLFLAASGIVYSIETVLTFKTIVLGAILLFGISYLSIKKILDRYYRNVRHDLKTPVSVISLALDHASKESSYIQDMPIIREQVSELVKRIDSVH